MRQLKLRLFHQLLDTLKESAQSGWAQTWEILFGNFEEVKNSLQVLTMLSGSFIGDQAPSYVMICSKDGKILVDEKIL
jgi:hypothetical protein